MTSTTPQTPPSRPAACLSRPGAGAYAEPVRWISAAAYVARLRAEEGA